MSSKTLETDLRCALHCLCSGQSDNSNNDVKNLFQSIFPDSNIVKTFTMDCGKLRM